MVGVYSEFVAGPAMFTLVGDAKPLSGASCSSYFWNVVLAGTVESRQSNRGLRFVASALVDGETKSGTEGGLATVDVLVGEEDIGVRVGVYVGVRVNVAVGVRVGVLLAVAAGVRVAVLVAVGAPGVDVAAVVLFVNV